MQKIAYDTKCLSDCVTPEKLESYREPAAEAETMLQEKKGPGNDFLGWLNLPIETDEPFLNSIKTKADEIRDRLKKMNIEIEDRPEGTIWKVLS